MRGVISVGLDSEMELEDVGDGTTDSLVKLSLSASCSSLLSSCSPGESRLLAVLGKQHRSVTQMEVLNPQCHTFDA